MTITTASATTGVRRVASIVFLVAVFVTAVGDEIAAIAILLHFAAGGHAGLVASLLVLQLAPAVLLAPFAGQLLDRRDAGRLLAVVSALQAAVMFAMSAWPNTATLLAGATGIGVLAAVAAPASIVLIPILAGSAFPARANGLLEVSRSASTLAGPVVGGVLTAAVGIRGALLVDACTFVAAAAAVALVGVRRPVEPGGGAWWKGATDGLRFLSRQGELRRLLPVLVITVSASSMVNVASPFFVDDVLDAGGVVLGVVTAAWGGGALLGALLAGRVEWRRPEQAVLAGAFAMGLAIVLFGLFAVVACTVVAAFLAGAANTYQNVAMRTSVQVRTPEHLLGRAHAAAGSVVNSFFLVGFVLGGFFAATHARGVYLVAGAVTVVVGGIGLLTGRARPVAPAQSSVAADC